MIAGIRTGVPGAGESPLPDIHGDILSIAEHLKDRQGAIVHTWQRAIARDPELTDGESLPRSELIDHIPALLDAFDLALRQTADAGTPVESSGLAAGAAHGLQRWQQGYNLREVTRELGKLNECVTLELDHYTKAHPQLSIEALTQVRQVWTNLCSRDIEESVSQYFALQQREAAGHVSDLEQALDEIRQLERERADLWRQAAHDLRGNLGVVANVSVGLTRHGRSDATREDFVRILVRNVTSLHQLLDDVTSLARLQAGREKRHLESLDVTTILEPLCEGIRPLAAHRNLFLKVDGPAGLGVDGDAVKIRRIAQNLILNAVKYTRQGGITVTWGDSEPGDPKRWLLCVKDTGPGFRTESGQPIAAALETRTGIEAESNTTSASEREDSALLDQLSIRDTPVRSLRGDAGEGIGLSIVKRLCEMLDATLEMQSVPGQGTIFRIFFPRFYSN
jgi:signal transduction histidine kinase